MRSRLASTALSGTGADDSSACVLGTQRGGVEAPLGRDFDDLAEIHDRDPVAEMTDDCKVVGDEQIGEPQAHAINRGASLAEVQSTLGHGNIATTSGYLHARPNTSSGLHLDPGVFLR
jgi:hypothetical protein